MALFFDGAWFDSQLKAVGLGREGLARLLGLSESELGEMWKDQREVSARDVVALADLFGVEAGEVARRAGVSTPVPPKALSGDLAAIDERIAGIERRLERIERLLLDLKAMVAEEWRARAPKDG